MGHILEVLAVARPWHERHMTRERSLLFVETRLAIPHGGLGLFGLTWLSKHALGTSPSFFFV